MNDLYCLIMAGGSGTRFWPASRRERPKQLLSVEAGRSLVQATLDRVPDEVGPERTIIVTNADQVAGLLEQVDLPRANVLAEPVGRDTAPCIGLAAALIEKRSPGAVMAVMAADHVIHPHERFKAAVLRAGHFAAEYDAIVTIGLKPDHPATGYGYVELGHEVEPGMHEVQSFKEKPDRATAEAFLARGGYLWNGGIFVWRAARILREIERSLPALAAGLKALAPALDGADLDVALQKVYPGLPKISIDHGVIEKAEGRYCLVADFEWDDVGSLAALARHNDRDAAGNVLLGEVLALDARGNIVDNRQRGLVALLGVEDLVVVRTGDAVLVARRGQEERVKEIVARLHEQSREDLL
ncbi:MAG: NTP transferase domain-containing protein [Planctomycetes bacterium]|nr:NTP transferase domain-containing protein [Planctomycetota bacterium]